MQELSPFNSWFCLDKGYFRFLFITETSVSCKPCEALYNANIIQISISALHRTSSDHHKPLLDETLS